MNNLREKAREIAAFIWSIADLLRGHYKRADFGKVILPFTVIRRLDLALEPTKQKVLAAYEKHKKSKPEALEPILNMVAGGKEMRFHNRSKFTFDALAKDHNAVAANIRNYLRGFSLHVREIIEYFNFDDQIRKLDEYDLLYLVVKRFAEAGEMLKGVNSICMGLAFEELIRKFAEDSNETAGEHFTPREVIRLIAYSKTRAKTKVQMINNTIHTETTFETAVIEMLIETGWTEGKVVDYDAELALDTKAVLDFLQRSQPLEWKRYVEFYKDDAEVKLFQRLHRELDLRGTLDVLRNGITDSGIKFQMAFFEPDQRTTARYIQLLANDLRRPFSYPQTTRLWNPLFLRDKK